MRILCAALERVSTESHTGNHCRVWREKYGQVWVFGRIIVEVLCRLAERKNLHSYYICPREK